VTPDELRRKYRNARLRPAIRSLEEVVIAWNDPGPVPEIHYRAKRRLRAEWPALAGALDLLTAVVLEDPEPRK
jgi:hypothetical protein